MTDAQSQPQAAADKGKAMQLVSCPKCGRSNSLGTRYCIICGEHLPATTDQQQVEAAAAGAKGGFLSRLFGRKK